MHTFLLFLLVMSALFAIVAISAFFSPVAEGHDNALPLLYYFA